MQVYISMQMYNLVSVLVFPSCIHGGPRSNDPWVAMSIDYVNIPDLNLETPDF